LDARKQEQGASARDDNQSRGTPGLPGSLLPARSAIPVAYIYQPARSPMQSGLARLHEWVLEFALWSPAEIEPLMGWTSSRDPFASIPRLRFPDRESAIAFAERHGWHYLARDPPIRRFRPKSYADNFKYNLAGLVNGGRAEWEGQVDIDSVRVPARGIGSRAGGA
jgi:ETC complex I subunit-like protein